MLEAAPALLGAYLIRGERVARIVETEAYSAEDDPGSHAYRRKTPRNAIMFGPPGRAYVYFNYGMHWMLNVVAHEEGKAAAVLVRAAEPIAGLEAMRLRRPGIRDLELLNGPGKLCRAFEITRADEGIDLLASDSDLRIVAGEPPAEILVATRVGLSPGKGEELLRRYVDRTRLPWVSKPRPPST